MSTIFHIVKGGEILNKEQQAMVGAKTKKPNKRLWEEIYLDPTNKILDPTNVMPLGINATWICIYHTTIHYITSVIVPLPLVLY